MDLIADLRESSLGSRFKRLGELLYNDYAELYDFAEVPFKPVWYLILNYFTRRASGSITEIAAALHVTHAHVTQVADQLITLQILAAHADPNDRRRRLLRLTAHGEQQVNRARPVWEAIRLAQEEIIAESGCDVLEIIERLEQAISRSSVYERASGYLEDDGFRARISMSSRPLRR
ncbi:MAG TPA: MarR family winged helix-turn-helix transcriptional regulator [Alkalispirochaeta sp.]|nr:MarR family winged helix-turn-helix transcriptional regulator [Alkalispirochaeta sp.]